MYLARCISFETDKQSRLMAAVVVYTWISLTHLAEA